MSQCAPEMYLRLLSLSDALPLTKAPPKTPHTRDRQDTNARSRRSSAHEKEAIISLSARVLDLNCTAPKVQYQEGGGDELEMRLSLPPPPSYQVLVLHKSAPSRPRQPNGWPPRRGVRSCGRGLDPRPPAACTMQYRVQQVAAPSLATKAKRTWKRGWAPRITSPHLRGRPSRLDHHMSLLGGVCQRGRLGTLCVRQRRRSRLGCVSSPAISTRGSGRRASVWTPGRLDCCVSWSLYPA